MNYQFASAGVCGTPMQEGDEVLLFPGCYGGDCAGDPTPLRITSAPASASAGKAFDVRVVQYVTAPDFSLHQEPAAGAAVAAGSRASPRAPTASLT